MKRMRSIRRALRLIVATGALLPLLASAPAEASIQDCGAYTNSTYPVYVQTGGSGVLSAVVACVGYPAGAAWPFVGVFLDPSQTRYPTFIGGFFGQHTGGLSGGVCVTVVYPVQGSECLHDPSFTVAAADRGGHVGKVEPCIDDTTPEGHPSLFGFGVGAACLSVDVDTSVNQHPDGTPSQVGVLPGVCLQKAGTYTCYVLQSWTTFNGAATSQNFVVCDPNCRPLP